MTLEQLSTFFGWCILFNSTILGLCAAIMIKGGSWMPRFHANLFDLTEASVRSDYFNFLATYKAITLALNIVPYIALKIIIAIAH